MESNAFVLYSRDKCPLCDKAKLVLEEVKVESGIGYKEIDIHTDDDLLERFGLMILSLNGKMKSFSSETLINQL